MGLNSKPTLYWSLLRHNDWKLYVASTTKGICYVGPNNKSFEELSLWSDKHFPGHILIEDDNKLEKYKVEIIEYLDGKLKKFTIPLDLKGTDFQLKVWDILFQIPYGETKTYSDIAIALNKPTAVRAVGGAIGANPILMTIPCHRVVGKNGSLTGFRGGLEMKTRLLELEGH
ncbi:methylated-DNA--[protein]-cysteine S-methyltransferase [Bacillus sp. FJAT-49732]|uniref:Methylated-DNA--protein-cysteine methyltransferase n=1 Tax=Lederbergia citrisecunda TaxID=2833583 RepID=A0A942TL27_9BACI|nr:methylated-DNA--[protein]-cysteine S-methyltransferase [Lederbergia citrisecunda]MBS4199183.1 methylated-DNA--[protein]-cysteine S-methyltransferase [Lederbergia citrisecunda]